MTSNPASAGPAPDGEVCLRERYAEDWDVCGCKRCLDSHRAPHPDREAEPAGGVVETLARLIEPNAWMIKDVNPDWQVFALTRKITAPKAVEQSLKKAAEILQALSVSPPVVEGGLGSSAEGADTHRAAGWPVHVFTGHGELEQQRQQARASETYKRGDMVMAWVNEGDLYANPHVVLEAARHQPTTPGEQGEEEA